MLISMPAMAQVSALGPGAVNTGFNIDSLEFSVPAGNDRVLIVAVQTLGDPSSLTIAGMSLTELGGFNVGAGVRGELWGLVLGDGPQFAGTITGGPFNKTNSWNQVAAQAFQGVDQSVPWNGITAEMISGDDNTSIDVASEAGDLVFNAIVGQGDGGVMSATSGPGQTDAFNATNGNGLGAGSYEPGATVTTMSWDFENFFFGAHMVLNLNGIKLDQIFKDGFEDQTESPEIPSAN